MFIESFVDDVTYVRMLKSVWSVRFVTYQGAFAMALRIEYYVTIKRDVTSLSDYDSAKQELPI
jgi:hypothetical protein